MGGGGGEGMTNSPEPPSPCLNDFLPTFPRQGGGMSEIRSVVARNERVITLVGRTM